MSIKTNERPQQAAAIGSAEHNWTVASHPRGRRLESQVSRLRRRVTVPPAPRIPNRERVPSVSSSHRIAVAALRRM
jgi:hypothetical protein